MKKLMEVTAWNNGQHHLTGAGYGIKIKAKDRDKYFDGNWKTISLKLKGKRDYVKVNIDKKSFWYSSVCREVGNKDVGIWLKENVKIPWKKGCPPKIIMENIGGNRFKIKVRQLKP